MSVGELVVSIIGDMQKLHAAFSEINKEISGFGQKIQAQAAKISSAGSAMSKAITVPIAAVTAGLGVATNSAMGFQSGMAEVFTLLPGLSQEMKDQMSDDILALSKELGVPTEELIPALYQALSAGIPADNVFEFLRTAAKTAIGGNASTEESVYALATAYNNYGGDIQDVTDYSDILFVTMQKGQTTIGETSKELGDMAPIAETLQIGLDEVGAAFALITAKGIDSAEAATYTKAMYREMKDEGSALNKVILETAGTTIPEYLAAGHDMADVLALLMDASEKTGVPVDNLFSSAEAGQATLMLTEGYDVFLSNMEAMQDRAGATETAYNTMNESATRALDQIKASINAIVLELGNNFLPILSGTLVPLIQDTLLPFLSDVVLPVLTTMLQIFGDLPQPVQLLIIGLTGLLAALGPVLIIIGSMASAIGSIAALFSTGGLLAGATPIIMGILSAIIPLLPIIAALAIAIGGVYLAFTHWDEIKKIAAGVWETINEILLNAYYYLVDYGGLIPLIVSDAFDQILEYLSDVDLNDAGTRIMNTLKTAITSGALFPPMIIFNMLNSLVKKITGVSLYSAGAALMSTFVAGIKAKIQDAYNTVRDGLNKINRLLPHSPAKEGPFKELPNWDALFVDPVQQSLGNMNSTALGGLQTVASTLQSASSSTTNNYAGDEFTIQNVNLSADYPFEKFARDMEQYNRQKRIRKGIPS